MKKTINIYAFCIAVLSACMTACHPQLPAVEFDVDSHLIEAFSEGGNFDLKLSSAQAWNATTDDPWISISPANGIRSAVCKVSIDSTVLTESRSGIIRFRNRSTGEVKDVKVTQDGYGYNIDILESGVSVKHYANVDDRVFEVKVRTNVPFSVVIPENARNWLSCEEPDVKLDRGARPRDITLKFKWNINSVPLSRQTEVSFQAQEGYDVPAVDKLQVKQDAAPEIVIGHDGDSTVILSIARNLNLLQQMTSAEAMANWDNVKLWEETDPGYTPDKKGRVRYAYFALFQTTEGIPYEVQYLTEAEELVFFSNVNSFRYDIDLGEHICKLKNLKKLTISAYGISSLPEEFTNLDKLEWLDLSSNNFATLPSILNPENFPNLHALMLNTCQRHYIMDLSNNVQTNLAGFKGPFPRELLEWEKLDTLRLSVNFIEGEMPDMLDYEVKYTAQDCVDMNLPPTLIGTPKVLPNAKYFAFNLNRMSGALPDWVLYHPNLTSWSPYALCYPQEGRASDGTAAFFNNVPVNMDYYWSFYEGYKEHEDIYIGD